MTRVAYLAGPIDQSGGDGPWRDTRAVLSFELRAMGYDVFRPDLAWDGGPLSHGIQAGNDAVISRCSLLVAQLPAGVPTLGTPVEIERALHHKIPVLIVTDLEGSVQLASWEHRGAVVCSAADIGIGLLEAAAKVEDRRPVLTALMRAAENMRQITAPQGLIFEPVGDGLGSLAQSTTLPTRGYADDAGLDLYVTESVEIEPHSFVDVSAGVKVDIPKGYWILILGRSSTLRKRNLMVSPGVIDAGWTGPLFAGVFNLGDETVKVEAGDRLAQAILLTAPVVGFRPEWGTVPAKERGEKGFGSTGS